MMAKQHKTKKQAAAPPLSAAQKREQSRPRKIFTVIICVVVALGLMLPVAGIGVASCSPTQTTQTQQD
ncbi:MAG: hypothetical protein LBH56_04545 [Coriobacteriales bacterium]|jgi:ABC-type Fe3+ transport system permease subunit|nr:hypothetical protein [Coriobacteriales bacterium]